jgi:hypothetical protein
MRFFALFLLLSAAALTVSAQPSNGYFVVGVGQASNSGYSTNLLQAVVGGEFVIKNSGIGVGAEIGGFGVGDNFISGATGVGSVNGYYHFRRGRGSRGFDPFVTGGYTAFFNESTREDLGNFGGGTNYWFKRFLGIRLEFRDHVYNQRAFSGNFTSHWWAVRFGVIF